MAQQTYVVMGVSGVGKTSVARAISSALSARYIEADDYHSHENIASMSAGRPLTDDMRQPWLEALAAEISAHRQALPGQPVVLACSALKRHYRDVLRTGDPQLKFIHLCAERALIHERLAARSDHFLPPDMLDSQLATLEPLTPRENHIEVNVAGPLQEVVNKVLQTLDHPVP